MRTALLAFAILLTSQASRAATAYEALRTLGKQKSEAVLDSVTEVRGDNGSPEPRVWKITAKDASRGVREFSVQGGKLAGDRPGHADGAPMNMSQLNLDSDGAHTVAEREAKKAGFAYDRASYTLRAGSKGGSPIWEIRLTDQQGGATASLHIAATTGNVLSSEGLKNRGKVAAVPAPEPVQEVTPAPRYQPAQEEPQPAPRGATPGIQRASDETNQFFDRVGNHMQRRGHQISDAFHNLFTGDHRNTAGPHGSRPTNVPAPQRAGDEDYVRPSRVRD